MCINLLKKLKFKTSQPTPLSFLDALVLFLFFFFILLFFASLMGWFKLPVVFLSILITWLILKYFFVTEKPKINRSLALLIILVILALIGFMFFKGFISGDATAAYLNYARQLVEEGRMGDYTFNIQEFYNTRAPLFNINLALVYFFFHVRDWAYPIIALFFSSLTIIFVWRWLKEKEVSEEYLKFIPLIFIIQPVAAYFGWEVYAESILIFLFTAFFYYFEKTLKEFKPRYIFLQLAIICLALLAKTYAAILFIPFLFLILKKDFWRTKCYYFFIVLLPYLFWLIRTYILYHNPIFPVFGSFFNDLFAPAKILVAPNAETSSEKIDFIIKNFGGMVKKIFLALPTLLLATLGFFSGKKISGKIKDIKPFDISARSEMSRQGGIISLTRLIIKYLKEWRPLNYLLIFILFILIIVYAAPDTSLVRHCYQFAGLLLVYFFIGLQKIKSKIITGLYFLLTWGMLFKLKIPMSESSFIRPWEIKFDFLFKFITFLNQYSWLIASFLALYLIIFIKKKESFKYLILWQLSAYLLYTSFIEISWLIVWLPTLFALVIFFIWPLLEKINLSHLKNLTFVYLIIFTLGLSSLLCVSYALAYHEFTFPKSYVIKNDWPVAEEIIKREGDNRDFYVVSDYDINLAWPFRFKTSGPPDSANFQILTGYAYRKDMTGQDVYKMLKRSNMKYIIRFSPAQHWEPFFKAVANSPQYFELIWQGESHDGKNIIRLWRAK